MNVWNSDKSNEYSSSEMESSDNAYKIRQLIMLSAETVNIAIFSCSIFNEGFLIAWFPTTRSKPITIDTASIPITAGATTIVERTANFSYI